MSAHDDTTPNVPDRPPIPFWQWAVMIAAPLLSLGLWRTSPEGPVSVAVIAILMLTAVFLGVSIVLRNRDLSKAPGENPVPPPSTTPPKS